MREGLAEARNEIIIQMLNDGLDNALIMKYCNVTLEEIEVLRQ